MKANEGPGYTSARSAGSRRREGGRRALKGVEAWEKVRSRLVEAVLGLLLLLLASSVYLHAAFGMGWIQAVYDSVFLATTVGVNNLVPHGTADRVVLSVMVLAEVSVALYAFSTLTGFFVERDIRQVWGRRRMQQKVRSLEGHIIIAGGGRVGRQASREVAEAGKEAVILEVDAAAATELAAQGHLVLRGDASDAALLEEAGIRRARGLVACVPRDADNLYIVLAARELNPALVIVARAEEPRSEKRLLQAGANRVVFPTRIGGRRLARLALQPASADLVDSGWLWRLGFDLVEMRVEDTSPLVDRTLKDLREDVRVLVIALGVGSELEVPPPADRAIRPGMRLVVAGDRSEIARFRELFHLPPDVDEA